MSGLIRLVIKGVVYIFIVIPVVRAIVGGLVGGGVGWFLGLVVAIGLAIWLETTGTSNRLLARIFSGNSGGGGNQASAGESLGQIFDPNASKGLETTMKCPNCGSQVTLINGHGKCRACDSAF